MKHQQYIRIVPGSNTAVLFIHGIFGSPDHFGEYIKEVPDSFSVYNILLDGHGKTVKDISSTSMKKWKMQVGNIVNSLCDSFDNIIVVAHSMGTLFAIEESIKHPDKIKSLFLLSIPANIRLKLSSATNSLKLIFNVKSNDPRQIAGKTTHSVTPSKKLWEYLGWIPRYLELFEEIKIAKTLIPAVSVKCRVYQSQKDEMVSMKSCDYIRANPEIKLSVLKNSSHFYYPPEDMSYLKSEFKDVLNIVQNSK